MKHLPQVNVTGPYQARPPVWPASLTAFADDLETVLAEGRHGLAEIAEALNAHHSRQADGSPWTADALRARLAELGR